MKKLLTLLLVMLLTFSLAACGDNETPSGNDDPGTSQTDGGENEPDSTPAPDEDSEENPASNEEEDDASADAPLPATGLPIGWPDNGYTKLVPAPDCGGKVISANEIGELFAIDLEWEMAQGLTYAQLLQDAGFGEDCVEKYEQYGYIDCTFNGVNVQLLDLFGTTSLTIMPVETE